MPPKVKKEAERLNQLISEGTVKVDDLDALISQGLDPEVVKYWKQYWGEAGKEGSEFGKLLTTETFKAKAAEEMSSFKVKVARAYELANEMVKRGLLTEDRTAVASQVDEIMKWNDEAFDSMNRVVAKHSVLSLRKEASVPQVGLIGSGDSQPLVASDFQSELDAAFSNRKY
jgi:polyhydroxyalkanoate synthesis regulator phasin